MAGVYQTFTSARTTWPDEPQLLTSLRSTVDATIGFSIDRTTRQIAVKKNSTWTGPQITAAQNAIDTAPAVSPQSVAQAEIDLWPIAQRALVLALIDQLNVIRGKLSPPLGNITPAAALQAVRDKAATL
jgi:hypothetical protein